MDPIRNPFTPGAGTPPPEMAGRQSILDTASIAVQRTKLRRPEKGMLLIGLRGVGKTVLLDRIREDALSHGLECPRIEMPEGRSLPSMLAPALRIALLNLSRSERAKERAQRALGAIAGFVKGLKVSYQDIELGFDAEAIPGLADNGNLEHDLAALLETVGEAAAAADTAVALFIDELQYVEESQLEALITALHRMAQLQLPIILFGAGLPQLRGQMGRAKSYAERLFSFPSIGPLPQEAAADAIRTPIHDAGAAIFADAVEAITTLTQGYPYFLQEWGKHAWTVAEKSPITAADVESATVLAVAELDASFFGVRFDRLSPAEKRYLRAMAELGEGPCRTGDIAAVLQREPQSLGPVRASLIKKGMVFSPSYGDTAFTVPLFDAFMRRLMPGDAWRTA